MATFRKRNNRWQVQVRSRVYGSISKRFHRKSDAQKWAIEQEALIQSGQWSRTTDCGSRNSDLLGKYLNDVTPKKRHPDPEKRRLNRLPKDPVAQHYLETFDSKAAAQFGDRRLADGARTTEYDLILLKNAWNIANKEWGWNVGPNPVEKSASRKPIKPGNVD